MQINKASFIKKLMNSKCQGMAYAEYRPECVCPKTEMCDFPQEFQTMFFRLERKFVRVANPEDLHKVCFQFDKLAPGRRFHQFSCCPNGSTRCYLFKQIFFK